MRTWIRAALHVLHGPAAQPHELTKLEEARHAAAQAGWYVHWSGLHWELRPR